MSESDDTDILLLIPPDLFTIASSHSSSSLSNYRHPQDSTVVSELLDHVQLLEDRISAIESRDTSLDPSVLDVNEFIADKSSQMNQSPCQRKSPLKSGNFYSPGSTQSNSLTTFCNAPGQQSLPGDSHHYSPSTRLSRQKFSTETSLDALKNRILTGNDQLTSSLDFSPSSRNYRDLEQSKKNFNGVDFNFKSPKKMDHTESVRRSLNDKLMELEVRKFSNSPSSSNKFDRKDRGLTDNRLDNDNLGVRPIEEVCRLNAAFADDLNKQKTDQNYITPLSDNFPLLSEYQTWQSQKPMSLTDFWLPDATKSAEETLKIKLEEEKFRREHCEQLIQALQKRLLEQEERVAVAIRVDKEKSDIISQFQTIWNKSKDRWHTLEMEHNKLQENMQETMAKHREEVSELQSQVAKKTEELEKTNNLLCECQEKYETAVKERIELLESHANELENYRKLVQTSEAHYEALKNDCEKLTEVKEKLEDNLKNIQTDLYKEQLRNSEVREEMSVIHKALDTCEAELNVLRQDKENLLLKLKEEENRNSLLEKKKLALLEDLQDVQKSEALLKDEIKSIIAQHESKKSELREVYQRQVDEVVNTKLKEFQAQLDAAELNFQVELDGKQRAIAECAARKIKGIIDKHQLEVNLLEEKHKEEIRLHEIRLSQIQKKNIALEAQLNAQLSSKTRLAGELHSLMEKQYHQALQIISTGNIQENCPPKPRGPTTNGVDRNHAVEMNGFTERLHDYMQPIKLDQMKCERKMDFQAAHRDYDESLLTLGSGDEFPTTRLSESKDDLKKYIQMFLQTQPPTKHFLGPSLVESQLNSPPICREVPRKYYLKAETHSSNDEGFEKNDIKDQMDADYPMRDKSKCSDDFTKMTNQVDMKFKPPWK